VASCFWVPIERCSPAPPSQAWCDGVSSLCSTAELTAIVVGHPSRGHTGRALGVVWLCVAGGCYGAYDANGRVEVSTTRGTAIKELAKSYEPPAVEERAPITAPLNTVAVTGIRPE
jgi:hypothetical protein